MENPKLNPTENSLVDIAHVVLLASYELNKSHLESNSVSDSEFKKIELSSSEQRIQPRPSEYRFEDEIKNFLSLDDEFLTGTWAEWQPLIK